MSDPNHFGSGRPVVFRGGTVLTLDGARQVLTDSDVLVIEDRIAAVGPALPVPDAAIEIDATGGIVMPGMIDTHRHMWQTAMRGYGADWTLTQYFVWYYLEWGKAFRPQDVYAGNLLGAIEAIDAGVTTTVDWSHGLQTVEHAEAAADALRAVPGRFVLAYGNIQQAPAEWTASPEFRDFANRHIPGDDMLGFQLAFDVTGDPAFPERPAFEVARELGVPVTTHAGVWGATNDDGIRLMHEHGFMTPQTVYVHAATLSAGLPTTALPPPAAQPRYPRRASRAPARATRPPGPCAGTGSRCRCRWTPRCGGAPTCSPRCAPPWAPTAPASTWRRTPAATPSRTSRCGPSTSSTGPPAAGRTR